jgi:hypothetical protein
MIKIRILIAVGLLVLSACSQGTPTVADEVPFSAACDQANEGQRIAVRGYLRLPDSFSGDLSVVLRLYETEAYEGEPVGVQTRFGTEPNQIEQVPLSYDDEDLQAHLADGTLAGYGTEVKVSGRVYVPSVEQDFECGLENPLLEAAN